MIITILCSSSVGASRPKQQPKWPENATCVVTRVAGLARVDRDSFRWGSSSNRVVSYFGFPFVLGNMFRSHVNHGTSMGRIKDAHLIQKV